MCFLRVLILSGYSIVSRRKMYWQNSSDTKNELACDAISRVRFQFIKSNIHCIDNTNLCQNDKFKKMTPVEQYHSVDETMVPFFGRLNCKKFIKSKKKKLLVILIVSNTLSWSKKEKKIINFDKK